MNVIILTSAEDDLEDGWHFYEEREAGVGDYFYDTVMKTIRSLRQEHGTHPSKGAFSRVLVRKFHCGIYYTTEPDRVVVRRVLDLRRNPKWIRRELKRSL